MTVLLELVVTVLSEVPQIQMVVLSLKDHRVHLPLYTSAGAYKSVSVRQTTFILVFSVPTDWLL